SVRDALRLVWPAKGGAIVRRRRAGLVLAGTLAALAVVAATRAQDSVADRATKVHYWPHRVFHIPLEVARVEKSFTDKNLPVPTHIQLYSSLARGQWQAAGTKKPLAGLDPLPDNKKGFSFTAARDGEYEFSVQYFFKDGSSSPVNLEELSPMLRVTIDTTLPVVRVNAVGNGVEWVATDDNLDPDGIRLQAKYPNWAEWKTVDVPAIRAAGTYAWKLQPGQALDVRVLARDLAGNENYSLPVQVPSTGAVNTAFPKAGGSDAPIAPGGGGGGLPQPRVDYVSNPNFDIDYRIERAGRSGIQAAQLYVQKQRGGWEPVKRFAIDPPATTGASLKLGYTAAEAEEGTYGFYVAPESGAGVKAPPPNPAAPPMVYVVYDKTAPYLKITGVRVGAGGAKGPTVEIMWETYDQNLLPDPISLEYALDKAAVQWNEISYRLRPGTPRQGADGLTRYVGQFQWEVPDEKLWKFYVRARSVDRAGNTSTDTRQEPVVVDLETPAASITGVRGSGTNPAPNGGSGANPRPQPPAPKTNPPPRPPAGDPVSPPTTPATPPPMSPATPPPIPSLPESGPG
ncbi:MAG TPA: hypothetical protein VH092_29150, partial [Urbifossiella sp.]|nr:hypothetical protein [Urbifossiella sp.]